MKLASYVWKNERHYGVLDGSRIRRLGASIHDFLHGQAEPLPELEGLPAVPVNEVRLLAPVPEPEKIICIGLNYRDHAREAGLQPPKFPVFFAKYRNALAGPYDPIVLPRVAEQVDYEAELAVVIGKPGRYIPAERALEHVAGYMVLNDVSARDYQFRSSQWIQGKTFDGFAPCGPYLVTADEVPDPNSLRIVLKLNGEVMQQSTTHEFIFSVSQLIAYLSDIMTLVPGDIISTGTPPGVGFARKPPVFLTPGDEVEIEIDKVGTIRNRVVAETT